MTEPLITKHRPDTWKGVVGQSAAVRSMEGLIKRREAQAFLLSGPSGTGKTTLARIAAKELDCSAENIIEKDAATYTGVDSMRELQSMLQYRPFGKSPSRAVIIDECHRASGAAMDSLLKVVEEPPPDTYWFFCTTNVAKVPQTIKTRCAHIQLKALSDKELGQLYDKVAEKEGIDLDGDVGDLVIREARGGARQLLVNMALCADAKDRKTAAQLLKTAVESNATIELCRFLASGGTWHKVMGIVNRIEDEPEGVRIIVVNYMSKALRDASSDKDARFFLGIIDAFSTSYNPAEGIAPLLLSIGRHMFGGSE